MYISRLKLLVFFALAPVALVTAAPGASGVGTEVHKASRCRNLPGDARWPNDEEWNKLNKTVKGRLRLGKPLGQTCYTPSIDFSRNECSQVREGWFNAET